MYIYMSYIYKELNVYGSHLTILLGKDHYYVQVQKKKCLEDTIY